MVPEALLVLLHLLVLLVLLCYMKTTVVIKAIPNMNGNSCRVFLIILVFELLIRSFFLKIN
jgi:hypothetical protein